MESLRVASMPPVLQLASPEWCTSTTLCEAPRPSGISSISTSE